MSFNRSVLTDGQYQRLVSGAIKKKLTRKISDGL